MVFLIKFSFNSIYESMDLTYFQYGNKISISLTAHALYGKYDALILRSIYHWRKLIECVLRNRARVLIHASWRRIAIMWGPGGGGRGRRGREVELCDGTRARTREGEAGLSAKRGEKTYFKTKMTNDSSRQSSTQQPNNSLTIRRIRVRTPYHLLSTRKGLSPCCRFAHLKERREKNTHLWFHSKRSLWREKHLNYSKVPLHLEP